MTNVLATLQARSFAQATAATASSYPPGRRLTGGQLAEYLDRRAFAVIGSRRPDGRPHAAISSFVRHGTAFWLPTVAGSVRERNVRHQPWLTLTVTEGDRGSHIAVLIEGPAGVVPIPEVPAGIRGAITGDWTAAWIRVNAERILSYASEGALP
jgi:hypothetical protein